MKPKILYFYVSPSSFVIKDLKILRTTFEVVEFRFYTKNKLFTPWLFLKQLVFVIKHLPSAKLFVSQFGGYHSLIPSLISKISKVKSLIVTGGTDCVSFPSIGYGNFRKAILGMATRFSYRLCSHIAPVHSSLMHYRYSYQDKDYKEQGILAFMPDLKTPYTVIHNGYDPLKWSAEGVIKQPNRFVTVTADINMRFTAKLKGIDLILELAERFPEYTFEIIGMPAEYPTGSVLKNLIKTPNIPNQELAAHLGKSEFYLQLSMSEGFPNALCEAMLCGCIPIVSAVGAMPDIVGDDEHILKHRSVEELAELVARLANKADKRELSCKFRQRIAEKYPESKREKELIRLAQELVQ